MSFLAVHGEESVRARRVRSSCQADRTLPSDGPRQERVEALPHPGARGILRCRDAHVVPAVVLDEEMPVAALGERDPAEPALHAVALVAELVRGVDRDPADHRDGERETDVIDGGEFPARPQPACEYKACVLDRQEQVCAPAVVTVSFQPLDHAVRRVVRVHADGQVKEREDHEHQERAIEPEHRQSRELNERPREERKRRDQQPEQPRIALGITPSHDVGGCINASLCHSGRYKCHTVCPQSSIQGVSVPP